MMSHIPPFFARCVKHQEKKTFFLEKRHQNKLKTFTELPGIKLISLNFSILGCKKIRRVYLKPKEYCLISSHTENIKVRQSKCFKDVLTQQVYCNVWRNFLLQFVGKFFIWGQTVTYDNKCQLPLESLSLRYGARSYFSMRTRMLSEEMSFNAEGFTHFVCILMSALSPTGAFYSIASKPEAGRVFVYQGQI